MTITVVRDAKTIEESRRKVRFCVTGSAAHTRLTPLLPSSWIDTSPYAAGAAATSSSTCTEADSLRRKEGGLDFLWENAPRHETKELRDHVKVYSHLPNGTQILDSKWVLARLLGRESNQKTKHDDNPLLAVLKTHCFKGRTGFAELCQTLQLLDPMQDFATTAHCSLRFRDLIESFDCDAQAMATGSHAEKTSPPLWVVKDAMANGAGGIWIVGPQNAHTMMDPGSTPLIEGHHYVAQEYTWPPVLFQGRKCHVRVYGCMASDGRAFVHDCCFLHVANHDFTMAANDNATLGDEFFDESVHITNCCANSHDPAKFAGEICASLTSEVWGCTSSDSGDSQPIVPLKQFAPSIYASVMALAEKTFPFLQGGQANGGFEYLGMDFILSMDGDKPLAYLLEVNAPPSQDTATGLPHAEDLHDTVIRDWMSLWVLPKLTGAHEVVGGWKCVYQNMQRANNTDLLPSKAALVNKIRWTIHERKLVKEQANRESVDFGDSFSDPLRLANEDLAATIRQQFPFFESADKVFFESAGGSQVPHLVIDSVTRSLSNRHRANAGAKAKAAAATTMSVLLGANPDNYAVHFGANATSLLRQLAQEYIRSGRIASADEIVISTENHLANVKPWVEAAHTVGATIRWLHVFPESSSESLIANLEDLVTNKTSLVVLCHASNILGEVRNIREMKKTVDRLSNEKAEFVVDGVAAVPHVFVDLDALDVDWYVVSCHKLFAPHLGVLVGRKGAARQLEIELGTANYEACAGICGLGEYFSGLSGVSTGESKGMNSDRGTLSRDVVKSAYCVISRVEARLTNLMLEWLRNSPNVKHMESAAAGSGVRIPVFSFRHSSLSSGDIVAACEEGGIIARRGKFLSCQSFREDFAIDDEDGVVRLSLAHYSTEAEIGRLSKVLQAIPGW